MIKKAGIYFFVAAFVTLCMTGCGHHPDMETAKLADVNKDYETAVLHYRELANFGIPEAKLQLGRHYLQGRGVPQDPVQAIALFEEAGKNKRNPKIAQDVLNAKVQAGAAAVSGKPGGVSVAQGMQFLKEAAGKGDKRALFELGLAYEKGKTVSRNVPLAVEYYTAAGALGYGRADFNRAFLYEKGKLVPQNLGLAKALYKSAAEKGYARAKENLKNFYEKPAESAQAAPKPVAVLARSTQPELILNP